MSTCLGALKVMRRRGVKKLQIRGLTASFRAWKNIAPALLATDNIRFWCSGSLGSKYHVLAGFTLNTELTRKSTGIAGCKHKHRHTNSQIHHILIRHSLVGETPKLKPSTTMKPSPRVLNGAFISRSEVLTTYFKQCFIRSPHYLLTTPADMAPLTEHKCCSSVIWISCNLQFIRDVWGGGETAWQTIRRGFAKSAGFETVTPNSVPFQLHWTAWYLGDNLFFDLPQPEGLLVQLWLYRHGKQNQAQGHTANGIETDKDVCCRGESS